MAVHKPQETLQGEEAIIALLAPLTRGHAGAFGLKDDCALLTPEPGTELVLKTDPVAEGVHFLSGDAPQDIAWKALAVNVSDLAAKGAAPHRLSDGAVVSHRAYHRLDDEFCRRPGDGPGSVRLPSVGGRHGSPARATDNLHHDHRLGTTGQDGATDHRSGRRYTVRVRDNRGCRTRLGTGQECGLASGLGTVGRRGGYPAPALPTPGAKTGAG